MTGRLAAVASAVAIASGPAPALPGFLNSLASPLNHYGLWAVLVLVFLEDFGIPVPGETVLIAAAGHTGDGRRRAGRLRRQALAGGADRRAARGGVPRGGPA